MFQDRFLNFIRKEKLVMPDEKVLLAVSGGLDSMVMYELFRESKLDFAVAHCNFQLRGGDSEQDERFVRTLCEKSGIPFFGVRFDTEEEAQRTGQSIEMAARKLRYTWFEKLRSEKGYASIATAHHLNDTLETVLFNLSKGTGIAGLRGIKAKNSHIIRPLSHFTRGELESYARKKRLEWREDHSNQDTRYMRNLIRHEVVPKLKQINPELERSMIRTTRRLSAAEHALELRIAELKSRLCSKSDTGLVIDLKQLKEEAFAEVALAEFLKPYGFNFAQCEEIISANDRTGSQFLADEYAALMNRGDLIISQKQHRAQEAIVIQEDQKSTEGFGLALHSSTPERSGYEIRKDSKVAVFDLDKLRFPLVWRQWQPGDRFRPLGMKGMKKLSDFMIDNKIPLNLKQRTTVLESDGEIIWVVGMRLDDRFKIKATSRRIFELRLEKR